MTDDTLSTIFETLRRLDALRGALDETEYRLVVQARQLGATWEQIGEELGGISRQAARERFRKQQRRYSM